ncbi:hypothetical protein [Sphingomonas sp. GM_Shp_2]|uniref:hypothetical protein n=1 Tax=Sphingomonas sp. GM_Shp_2 TaxID=2937380 RepID=UPI00226A62FF|nr:hypothetical protein [Sphingomonas sp. GM_Shp_2]
MNLILALLACLLPTHTVDGIVSFLSKVAERLAATEAAQNARAADLRSRAALLEAAAVAADDEGTRAARVRSKLSDLVA